MGGGLYPDGSLSGGGVSVCGRVGKGGGSLSVAGWGRGGGSLSRRVSVWVGLCLGGGLSVHGGLPFLPFPHHCEQND